MMNMENNGRKFVNELGNEIKICVNEQDIEGVPGIVIFISGPTSETTNHVTRMEAKIIYDQLKQLLDKEEPKE